MTLEQFFLNHPRVALGFSGGVDSAYLLYAARQCGAQVMPYFVKTAFQPAFELADARRLAEELAVPLIVVEHDILAHEAVRRNDPQRCYHCKQRLFGALMERARADGLDTIIDGTNASDDAQDRPGMRALQEMQVLSPLRLCGITKDEVRRRSAQAGLFTADKPAYACLATRIPTGTAIEPGDLQRAQRAEEAMRAMGFCDLRVRVWGSVARLQVPQGQIDKAAALREEIIAALKEDFTAVTLDLAGR